METTVQPSFLMMYAKTLKNGHFGRFIEHQRRQPTPTPNGNCSIISTKTPSPTGRKGLESRSPATNSKREGLHMNDIVLKPKRHRRTKAQMAEARAQAEFSAMVAEMLPLAEERLKSATPAQIYVAKRLARRVGRGSRFSR
jgi:hypothetical protein